MTFICFVLDIMECIFISLFCVKDFHAITTCEEHNRQVFNCNVIDEHPYILCIIYYCVYIDTDI